MSNKRCIAVAELAVVLSHFAARKDGPGQLSSRSFVLADVASKLTSLELSAQRHAERLCNGLVSEEADTKARARLVKRAAAQLMRIGLDAAITVEVGGDPRGCCLRLRHPWLPANGFASEAGEYKVGC